ncbi:uncharacterized protein JCM6883_003559 [Sporobolomyces salmoneus]|uniref:uncharacterized protein n=1 Tax=Sporobolomyces salmoneus TaxID=183962 RepID=UPI00316DCA49
MSLAHQTTFRYQLFALCVAFAQVLHAAPIPQPAFPTPLTVSTGLPTPGAPSSSTTSSLVSAQQLWPSPLTLTDPSPSPSATPLSTSSVSSSSSIPVVSTDTVVSTNTELITVTATQTAAPVTVTQTLLFTSTVTTDLPDSSAAVFSSLPSPISTASTSTEAPSTASASITPKPSAKAAWTVPTDFSGNVTKALGSNRWSWGAKNVKLVDNIPSSAFATPSSSPAGNQAAVAPAVDLSNGPAMQVTFPKGSINPANKKAPTGGVGLYMSPLDLSKASNVSLEYSVFFPSDFDFVKGGKLPGMYGGHKGCSGGQDSEDCFSTRLMFRSGGKGELYLYAPKSDPAKSEELCSSPPLSYCDSSYGWSIGRGAWTFERGAWSNIRQEIRLNTPGVADGGVRIFVNDKLVLSSDAVLYRADLAPASSTPASPFSSLPTAAPQPTETSTAVPEATSTASDEGLLGGLLGGLADDLGQIIKKRSDDIFNELPAVTETVFAHPTETVFATSTILARPTSVFSPPPPPPAAPAVAPPAQAGLLGQVAGELPSLAGSGVLPAVADALPVLGSGSILAPKKSSGNDENATFQGIMFNTFFGGNDPSWASPKEQDIWFNRISLYVLA